MNRSHRPFLPRAPGRRGALQLLGAAALGGLLPTLPACASDAQHPLAPGARSITLSEAQLADMIGKKFPFRRQMLGVLELTLVRPRVRLLPEANRLGTLIDMLVTEQILGTRYDGLMELDYGLRFVPEDRSIRMSGVHVGRVEFAGVPAAYQSQFVRAAPRVAEQLLGELTLYQVPAEQLALANGLGFTVGELRVTRQGLRVELRPLAPGG